MRKEELIAGLKALLLGPNKPAGVSEEQIRRYFAKHGERLGEQLTPIVAMINAQSEYPTAWKWTDSERVKANVAAIKFIASYKAGRRLSAAERKILRGYTGWGGLKREANLREIPESWRPSEYSLVHEYYTPSNITLAIAKALCPHLPALAGGDGKIKALEPSVGIGRFVDAFRRVQCTEKIPPIAWETIELSPIAAALFALLNPGVELKQSSLETWAVGNFTKFDARLGLVISNPPFGPRGHYAQQDQDPEYKESRAEAYFMRRTLDMLRPFGIGVFLVPAGVLSGTGVNNRRLRENLLRRHHLMSAFRLPNKTFPGAELIVDIQFWRARGGELSEVDDADKYILEGRYFEVRKAHVLGEEVGDPNAPSRYSYKVKGRFTELPELVERALCSTCVVQQTVRKPPPKPRKGGIRRRVADTAGLDPALSSAVCLGMRVGEYLRLASAGDESAVLMHSELVRSLLEFQKSEFLTKHGGNPNPWMWMALRRLVDRENEGAESFLHAWTRGGELVYAVTKAPTVVHQFSGDPQDVVAQATTLYRSRRVLKIGELLDFHAAYGGTLPRQAVLERLFAAGWALDGSLEKQENLIPFKDYLTGYLWPRYDVAKKMASTSAQWALQLSRLEKTLKIVDWDDIAADVSPTQGWLPIELLSAWISDTSNKALGPVDLAFDDGLYQFVQVQYELSETASAIADETVHVLGWLNHDNQLFLPSGAPPTINESLVPERLDDEDEDDDREPSVHDHRIQWDWYWRQSFIRWVAADPTRKKLAEDAYNRKFKGYKEPDFSADNRGPIDIARWTGPIVLHKYQLAGVHRLLENRGGLLAFDVGLGKTFSGIALLARAKQEGWARRPVVLVPGSLAFKWLESFKVALPDYRVLVIGQSLHKRKVGKEVKAARERYARGEISAEQLDALLTTSKSDDVEVQAEKWLAFMSGAYDAVILTRDAMPRTKMSEDAVVKITERHATIARSMRLTQRRLTARKKQKEKKKEKLSERETALLNEGAKAWVREKLQLRPGWKYVPGISWDDIGVDLLVVDEATDYKNLFLPAQRQGQPIKYLGSPGPGSQRAWAFQFRCQTVRERTGGAGVVLLSATPAKNSPVELYNMIQYVDGEAWSRIGITDPERFIDRYIDLEYRLTLNSALKLKLRPVVSGFKNLDELRGIVFRHSTYKTADDVKLKVPKGRKRMVRLTLDARQEVKYKALLAKMEMLLQNSATSLEARTAVLGAEQRLNSIAIHADLDEGYTWETALDGGLVRKKVDVDAAKAWVKRGWSVAKVNKKEGVAHLEKDLPPPDPRSPKFVHLSELIVANLHCGHVVFCQQVVPHRWMRAVLISAGVPPERIAILNAILTKPADRQRIATAFNGDPAIGLEPQFDVVIANSVAYEGIDLQRRTCQLHKIDLGQTPMEEVQKNGRAIRQGNELAVVDVFYYIMKKSTDLLRMQRIDGKSTWIRQFFNSSASSLANPADVDGEDGSVENMLLSLSRNPERTKRILEERQEQVRERLRKKRATNASRLFALASSKYRDARQRRVSDPQRAAKLQSEASKLVTDLRTTTKVDAWPWIEWIDEVRDVEYFVPPGGESPVFEGLRINRRSAWGSAESFEFGRITYNSVTNEFTIGSRRAGDGVWTQLSIDQVVSLKITPEHMPGQSSYVWPSDDDDRTRVAIRDHIDRGGGTGEGWTAVGWHGASEAFVAKWWPVFGARIVKLFQQWKISLPVLIDGSLELREGIAIMDGEVLEPTPAGWRKFLELAPATKLKYSDLKEVAQSWFSRVLLRGIRAGRENSETIAEAVAPTPATGTAPASGDSTPASAATTRGLLRLSIPRVLFDELKKLEQAKGDRGRSPEEFEWLSALKSANVRADEATIQVPRSAIDAVFDSLNELAQIWERKRDSDRRTEIVAEFIPRAIIELSRLRDAPDTAPAPSAAPVMAPSTAPAPSATAPAAPATEPALEDVTAQVMAGVGGRTRPEPGTALARAADWFAASVQEWPSLSGLLSVVDARDPNLVEKLERAFLEDTRRVRIENAESGVVWLPKEAVDGSDVIYQSDSGPTKAEVSPRADRPAKNGLEAYADLDEVLERGTEVYLHRRYYREGDSDYRNKPFDYLLQAWKLIRRVRKQLRGSLTPPQEANDAAMLAVVERTLARLVGQARA